MARSLFGWAALAALLLIHLTAAHAADRSSLAVEATGVTATGGHFALNMSVWNCTAHDITVDYMNLPWGQDTVGLVLYKGAGMGDVLTRGYPIEDSISRDVVVRAGQSISGDINLDLKFPQLLKIKDLSDVVVFWVYDGTKTRLPSMGTVGGMVLLTRKPPSRIDVVNPCR